MKLTDKQINQIEELLDMKYQKHNFGGEIVDLTSDVFIGDYNGGVYRRFLWINRNKITYFLWAKNHIDQTIGMPIDKLLKLAKILNQKITRKELHDKYIKYRIIIPLDRKDWIKNWSPLKGKFDCSSCGKHPCNVMMWWDEHFCYRCWSNAWPQLYIPGHTDVDYGKLEKELKECTSAKY